VIEQAVQTLVDVASVGGLYALTALGIGLIFGVMRLINFAHAQLIMAAGYMVLLLFAQSAALAIAGGVIGAVALALIIERMAFRPLRGADPATLLIASFAASFFIEKLMVMFVGSRPKGVDFLPFLAKQVEVAGVRLQLLQIVTIAVSVVLLVGTTWFLK
jgi:branched-chain amino acid transport system permease protein